LEYGWKGSFDLRFISAVRNVDEGDGGNYNAANGKVDVKA
jgi:hypothetical protein